MHAVLRVIGQDEGEGTKERVGPGRVLLCDVRLVGLEPASRAGRNDLLNFIIAFYSSNLGILGTLKRARLAAVHRTSYMHVTLITYASIASGGWMNRGADVDRGRVVSATSILKCYTTDGELLLQLRFIQVLREIYI